MRFWCMSTPWKIEGELMIIVAHILGFALIFIASSFDFMNFSLKASNLQFFVDLPSLIIVLLPTIYYAATVHGWKCWWDSKKSIRTDKALPARSWQSFTDLGNFRDFSGGDSITTRFERSCWTMGALPGYSSITHYIILRNSLLYVVPRIQKSDWAANYRLNPMARFHEKHDLPGFSVQSNSNQ